jgi:HEAT repeat protein
LGTNEQLVTRLVELRREPDGAAAPEVARALGHRSAHVVSSAAHAAAELDSRELTTPLVAAFERLMRRGRRGDPGSMARVAIVEALRRLGADCDEVFLAGLRCVERVGSRGPDPAGTLRGVCGVALADQDHPDALLFAADLLADPEAAARSGGARAVAALGRPAGLPLLRLRASLGDPEPSVLEDCFSALLALDPEGQLSFVGGFLGLPRPGVTSGPLPGARFDEPVEETAALALGASRLEAALPPLSAWAEQLGGSDRRPFAWSAIAMLRIEAAWDFLASQIEDGSSGAAREVVRALAPFASDPRLASKVHAAAQLRDEPAVSREVAQRFGEG